MRWIGRPLSRAAWAECRPQIRSLGAAPAKWSPSGASVPRPAPAGPRRSNPISSAGGRGREPRDRNREPPVPSGARAPAGRGPEDVGRGGRPASGRRSKRAERSGRRCSGRRSQRRSSERPNSARSGRRSPKRDASPRRGPAPSPSRPRGVHSPSGRPASRLGRERSGPELSGLEPQPGRRLPAGRIGAPGRPEPRLGGRPEGPPPGRRAPRSGRESGRRSGRGLMGGRTGGGRGLLEVIQQLGQPPWIAQKEPSQHRLKSRGLPIGRWVAAARPRTGAIAAATHLVALLRAEQRLQPQQGTGLGLGLDLGHNGPVQVGTPPGPAAMPQTLVQLPDRVTEPGQLQGPEIGTRQGRGQPLQPAAGVVRPRRAGQGRC